MEEPKEYKFCRDCVYTRDGGHTCQNIDIHKNIVKRDWKNEKAKLFYEHQLGLILSGYSSDVWCTTLRMDPKYQDCPHWKKKKSWWQRFMDYLNE